MWDRSTGGALVLAVVAVGCAAGGGGAAGGEPTFPTVVTFAPAVEVSAAVTTSTTEPPDTTAAVVSEAPSTSAPTTQATVPPTVAPTAPPVSEPLAVQELVLSGEALGSSLFGADPDGVVEYVSSIIGAPTDDTGWVPPDTFADCGGSRVRKVEWGVLALLFSDLSKIANGRDHFIGYEYGRVGQIGDDPAGLRTEGSITLGSRVVDLLAEFPDAVINEGDEAVGIPHSFYVSDVFYGLLTGTTLDDYVTVLFGGYGCFE